MSTSDTPFSESQPSKGRGSTRRVKGPSPLIITGGILLVLIGVVLAAAYFWTEILWFDQMKASRVLWTRWLATIILFIVGALAIFAFASLNIRAAYKWRPRGASVHVSATVRAYQKAFEPIRKLVFLAVPAVVGLVYASGLSSKWQHVLTFINRVSFGEQDPILHEDISFYVFVLPFLEDITTFFLTMLGIAALGSALVHYFYGGFSVTPRLYATKKARMHVGILAAAFSLVVGIHYWLARYTLLVSQEGDYHGGLYTDINAKLPSQSILAVISLLVAVLFLIAAFKGTWKLPVTGVVVMIVSALVIGGLYPMLTQQFRVTPNARELDSPFIQHNIDATFNAYGMRGLETQNYDKAETTAKPGQLREDSESTSQIRLLDPLVVTKTVQQLQQSRPYYGFDSGMSVDRYTINGERRDTVIAMRELSLKGLSQAQQTWVNRHTVYTHGFGVVAAFGNTIKSDGTPAYWESSIPSKGEMGEYEPRIYFSPNSPEYSIVGAAEGAAPQELDYPDDSATSGQVPTTFKGNGGPSVGNIWNKLLYSIKFGSSDIFFSSQTNANSQILYDRDPLTRIAKVAPFLTLEQKPYPAVVDMDGDPSTPKRLVWVVDAYTTTNAYPYSQHQALSTATTDSRSQTVGKYNQGNTINYVRNSVKAVVDAYDGSVRLFQWDKDDPILKTWMNVYPGLIENISNISGDLMGHLRYPEDLFKIQRELLTQYHVTNAADLYSGADRWKLAQETSTFNLASVSGSGSDAQQAGAAADPNSRSASSTVQPPYYLTMQMPGQKSAEFSLTSVFVPGGESKREAMAGFLAVDSETGNEPGKVREGYGKLRLLQLPSSTTVPGPGQIQNNLDSNSEIVSKLNLLNQADSTVIRGNLLTLPVGGGLLYVQPVYVQSKGDTSYPILRQVLTAFGDKVGFAPTLQESLDITFGGDSAATLADGEQAPQSNSQGSQSGGGGTSSSFTPTDTTANQRLTSALADASAAMREGDNARKSGDWAGYGAAQSKIDKAIKDAVNAQDEINRLSAKETVGQTAQSN